MEYQFFFSHIYLCEWFAEWTAILYHHCFIASSITACYVAAVLSMQDINVF